MPNFSCGSMLAVCDIVLGIFSGCLIFHTSSHTKRLTVKALTTISSNCACSFDAQFCKDAIVVICGKQVTLARFLVHFHVFLCVSWAIVFWVSMS